MLKAGVKTSEFWLAIASPVIMSILQQAEIFNLPAESLWGIWIYVAGRCGVKISQQWKAKGGPNA